MNAPVKRLVSLDNRVTLVFSNIMHQIIINNKTYNIGNILGKSNAVVLDAFPDYVTLDDPDTSGLCLKIARHGLIDLDEQKIQYINSHPDDFTRVYEFESNVTFDEDIYINTIEFGRSIDICIMEKVTGTLHDICAQAQSIQKYFSFRFLNFMTQRLIAIINDLTAAGYYYTDLKPGNVGFIAYGDQMVIKLIDVDSISNIKHQMLSTYYTSGGISPKLDITRLQYLNVFFTILSMLFLDHAEIMCSPDYSKFNYDQAMHIYMTWFSPYNSKQHASWLKSDRVSCIYYKYALLIGTYKIIEDSLKPDFRMRDVLNNFDTIVKKVSMVISNKQNHKSYYFNFIARSLVVMFLVFMCRPDDIPRMVYTCMKLPIITNDGLPISTAIQNKFFSQVYVFTSDNFIEPQVLIGVSIVNSMRKYITSYCTDDSCIGLKKYGEYFLNADTY